MGSRYPRAAGSLRSHCGVRLVGLSLRDAPILLHEAALVQGVSAESTARSDGRNQNGILRVLRASKDSTQRALRISVTSVLSFFWPRRTRRHYLREKKPSRADKKFRNSSTRECWGGKGVSCLCLSPGLSASCAQCAGGPYLRLSDPLFILYRPPFASHFKPQRSDAHGPMYRWARICPQAWNFG